MIEKPLIETIDTIRSTLHVLEVQHTDILFEDPIRDRLDYLVDGRVGEGFSGQELADSTAKAKRRLDDGVPSGPKDLKRKDEPRCYGDVVRPRV